MRRGGQQPLPQRPEGSGLGQGRLQCGLSHGGPGSQGMGLRTAKPLVDPLQPGPELSKAGRGVPIHCLFYYSPSTLPEALSLSELTEIPSQNRSAAAHSLLGLLGEVARHACSQVQTNPDTGYTGPSGLRS